MHSEAIHPGYTNSTYQTDSPITASIKHNIFISKSNIQQHKAENDLKKKLLMHQIIQVLESMTSSSMQKKSQDI